MSGGCVLSMDCDCLYDSPSWVQSVSKMAGIKSEAVNRGACLRRMHDFLIDLNSRASCPAKQLAER